jgi:hypothetical protein
MFNVFKANKNLVEENIRLRELVKVLEDGIKRRDEMMILMLEPSNYITLKRFDSSLRKDRKPTPQETETIDKINKRRAQDASELSNMIGAMNGLEPVKAEGANESES